MQFNLTPDQFTFLVSALGPLLVGAITGLKTPTKIKTLLAVVFMLLGSLAQMYFNGQLGTDLAKDVVLLVAAWGGFYKLFAGTDITTWLQANVPIYLGQARTVLDAADDVFTPVPVTRGTPQQTNNGVKDFDGPQDVSQDPIDDYSSTPE